MIRIVVALDGSGLAEQALEHAVVLARSFKSDVHVVHVLERDAAFRGVHGDGRHQAVRAYLSRLKSELAGQRVNVSCHELEGDAPRVILDFCSDHAVDLLVLSAYGEGGVTEFPCGGTARKVVSRAAMSILVVRPHPVPLGVPVRGYRRILAVLDGSKSSERALDSAAALARAQRAELRLLEIVQAPRTSPSVLGSAEGRHLVGRLIDMSRADARRHVDALRVRLPGNVPVHSRVVVAPKAGPVVYETVVADNPDLLVLGAHGASGSYWLYGQASETIVAHAMCTILVVEDRGRRGLVFEPVRGEPARSPRTGSARSVQQS